MLKSVGILVGGIFIGAVGTEIIVKKCPNMLNKVCTKTRKVASGMKEAFKNGYRGAMPAEEVAEPTA